MNNHEYSHQNALQRQPVLRPPVGEEPSKVNYSNQTKYVKMKHLYEELYFITDGYCFIFLNIT